MDDEPGSVRAPTPPASDVSVNWAWDPLDPDRAPDLRDEDPAELRFIRLSGKATLPTRAHDDDAGLDLYSAEGARIGPGQRVSVGTGLAVAIPEGLAGLVLPRSGLALKHGIALVNAPGLIDPGYRGEVRVLLLNTDRTSEFRISPGDRIAQLLLVPVAHASPLEADSLESSARGPSGFGSSGLD
jgi:dUTP pyrophosphatase